NVDTRRAARGTRRVRDGPPMIALTGTDDRAACPNLAVGDEWFDGKPCAEQLERVQSKARRLNLCVQNADIQPLSQRLQSMCGRRQERGPGSKEFTHAAVFGLGKEPASLGRVIERRNEGEGHAGSDRRSVAPCGSSTMRQAIHTPVCPRELSNAHRVRSLIPG